MDQDVTAFRQMIKTSNKIAVFTGAGISTESGIPDFRGPNGIWNKVTPIDFNDFVSSEDVRRESWRRKFSGDDMMTGAEPNAGHLAINQLVQMGKVSHVITQNVDGLHHRSGVPEEQIIELHVNANYTTCLDCGHRYELEDIKRSFLADESLPSCTLCQGIIKTATVSFGQSMPAKEMKRAEEATFACDMFIAIGSSLVVYPAAGFPRMAKQNGAMLAILNNEPTDIDLVADLVLHRQIGPTLSAVVD